MTLYDKLKWILGILMVFALIITTNLIDKNNFTRVRDSVVTIYEDRLVAKDLIIKMLSDIHAKEIAVKTSDSSFFLNKNKIINTNLEALITKYEKTKLIPDERKEFEDFKNNLTLLLDEEKDFFTKNNTSKLIVYLTNLKQNLNNLATIQLNEGSRQMSISKKALNKVELFTQIEIYILVFLALVIQVIVMYNPKK